MTKTTEPPVRTENVTNPEVDPRDRPTGFSYHVLYANAEKYDEMVRFYQILFGAQAKAVPDGLTPEQVADPEHDLILIVKREGLPSFNFEAKTGFNHMAYSYSSLAELMYVYRHARDNGLKTFESLNSEVLLQLYYFDPEGNRVEIGVDGHDTSEETQHYARLADGARQPGKIDHWKYDPETILKMLEAGVSDYDIFNHEKYHAMAASGRFQ